MSSNENSSRFLLRCSALAGLFSPLVLAVAATWVASQRADYSYIRDPLSELGAVGRPNALLMNLAGIIPAGLLTASSAPAIYRLYGKGRLSRAGEIALVLGGLGFVATVLFAWQGAPTDLSSANNKFHLIFALAAFFFLALAPLLFGLQARAVSKARFAVSIAAAAGVFVLGFILPHPPYFGIFQRGALLCFFIWLAVSSIQSLRHSASPDIR